MKIELELGVMTPAEAGKFLRQMAEMTTRNSQNWDSYEAIATSILQSAFDHVGFHFERQC